MTYKRWIVYYFCLFCFGGAVWVFCYFGLTPIVDYHNSILGGKSKVVRLEMRVAELEDLCRWEKVLSQLLNPVQKLELDLFEEQIKQRKERSGAN